MQPRETPQGRPRLVNVLDKKEDRKGGYLLLNNMDPTLRSLFVGQTKKVVFKGYLDGS